MKTLTALLGLLLTPVSADALELHVALTGNDTAPGTAAAPLRTISAAAQRAVPGDVITVHAGTYRERVTPPRGGTSDQARIVYQAAPGESVVIKGSELIRGWRKHQGTVWTVTLPDVFFGGYNPYRDLIAGDWFTDKGRPHHTGEVYLNGKSLWETHQLEKVLNPSPQPDVRDPEGSTWMWFCVSDGSNTTLYANFHDRDPNAELVEINVRDSCFYPDQPGRDFITVRGFRMCHAATQWAAPTAEQIGLIGTHWSKGWIIEDNVISDSKCSGITLGKDRATGHNVWSNDRSKDGAIHYNEVVDRALAAGWSREKIGSHLVRRNTISHCEQTGICGSLGAIFSRITDNHIHDIWEKRQFTGAEMAGVKLHAAIDVLIQHNRIDHAGRGIWLDWMAQGTRVTGNLCYANTTDDLFVEVNHGPYLVDNNLFLSALSVQDWSQGGAFAHNLVTGRIVRRAELKRFTPHHAPHATAVAGRQSIPGGDNRFFNNLLVSPDGGDGAPAKPDPKQPRAAGHGLWVYDAAGASSHYGGNTYAHGARAAAGDTASVSHPDWNPQFVVEEEGPRVFLRWNHAGELAGQTSSYVTTARLGKTKVAGLAFEDTDGSPVTVNRDYFGAVRAAQPTPGPFEQPARGPLRLPVW